LTEIDKSVLPTPMGKLPTYLVPSVSSLIPTLNTRIYLIILPITFNRLRSLSFRRRGSDFNLLQMHKQRPRHLEVLKTQIPYWCAKIDTIARSLLSQLTRWN